MSAPQKAMLLCAGRGERMRPLSESCPKPLLPLNGKPLLVRSLDRLEEFGVGEVVVNLHHLGEMIRAYLAPRPAPALVFSEEKELLDTGGGVAKALSHFGNEAFYVINGDILWGEGKASSLGALAAFWREGEMDALLLLQPREKATGYEGAGDYSFKEAAEAYCL